MRLQLAELLFEILLISWVTINVGLAVDLDATDDTKKDSDYRLPILLSLVQTVTYKHYLSVLLLLLIWFAHLTAEMEYLLLLGH